MQRPQRPQLQGRKAHRAFINAQGCAMVVTTSRYARMHNDSHTKPLHDATAQTAVGARTHRPQRPQTHGCVIVLAPSFKHGCLKSAALSCHTMWQPKWLSMHLCTDPNDRNCTNAYKQQLIQFLSNLLTNCNNILQNPFKFVILYQKSRRNDNIHKGSGCRF